MCNKIGEENSAAVDAVREIMEEHANYQGSKPERAEDCTTDADADLLKAWRAAASDPDTAVCQWLKTGAPAGTDSANILQ